MAEFQKPMSLKIGHTFILTNITVVLFLDILK